MEENVGMLYFDVVRTQGLEGRVSVDVTTQPGTAVTMADLTEITFAPVQFIPGAQRVQSFHSFVVEQTTYLVMLTSARVGELTTGAGSDGSARVIDLNSFTQSTIFRWQGELVPIQVSYFPIQVSY